MLAGVVAAAGAVVPDGVAVLAGVAVAEVAVPDGDAVVAVAVLGGVALAGVAVPDGVAVLAGVVAPAGVVLVPSVGLGSVPGPVAFGPPGVGARGFGSGPIGAGIIGSVIGRCGDGVVLGGAAEGEPLFPPPEPDVLVTVGLAGAVADVGDVDAGAVAVGVELGGVTHSTPQHSEFPVAVSTAAFIAGSSQPTGPAVLVPPGPADVRSAEGLLEDEDGLEAEDELEAVGCGCG